MPLEFHDVRNPPSSLYPPPKSRPRRHGSSQSRRPDRVRTPAIRLRYRRVFGLALGLVTATCFITPAIALSFTPAVGATMRSAAGPSTITKADTELDSLMLATPLPGLTSFTLVGPGATNGPLSAQTLGSYSSNPHQVEQLFDQYSSESGFAGWIKTWQDSTGSSQVVEIAIRFHQSAEASTNASAFVSTLSKGLSGGTRAKVSSIPGANAFTIDEPSTTSGTLTIPAQQVQAVVFSSGNYLIALHTDSPSGPGAHPIAAGTAIALALQQYQVLASKLPPVVKPSTKTSSGSSTIQVVGLIMLGAVALVIASIALVSWRRRQTQSPRHSVRSRPAKPVLGSAENAGNAEARATGAAGTGGVAGPGENRAGVDSSTRTGTGPMKGWPESPALPTPLPGKEAGVGAPSNGVNRNTPDRPRRHRTGANQGTASRNGAQSGNATEGASEHKSGSKRVSFGRLSRPSSTGSGAEPGARDRLVATAPPIPRGTRSRRLDISRTNHPSASVALAKARPPADSAGWYTDPSDGQQRRIRYWDGKAWTSHVAEPEV
jgi:hypothetical protein